MQINPQPQINDLTSFGISMDDLRFLNDTKEMQSTIPPMVVVKVTENFNINLDNQIYDLLKDEVYVMQFNLFYSVYNFLVRDNKTHVFEKYEQNFKDFYKPYQGQNLDNKTLFVMATSIGDTLFMQPTIKYIKEQYPTCKIIYAASKTIRDLISCYPKGLIDTIYESTLFIKKEVITNSDYHLYSNFVITKNMESHKKNAYKIFSEYAGIDIDFKKYKTELQPKKWILDEVNKRLPKRSFVVCQVRASTSNRMIQSEKWVYITENLIDLGYDVVFIDTPDFYDLYNNDIILKLPEEKRIHTYNLSKIAKGLKYTISIISKSDAVIGIDSALIHIGGALDKPVLGIYTAFTGDVRINTFDRYEYVQPKNCKCILYPCYYHQDELSMGYCEYARFGDFPDCVTKVDEKEIIEKFKKLME